jgi:septal ring factor EnvC (AmiA/AmiB activator)
MTLPQSNNMRLPSVHLVLISASLLAVPALAQDALADTRSTLEKWVETRQLISQTRADWQADKESLEQTIALYERELKAIDEQMAKVSTNNTQVTKEMAEAEALRRSSGEANDAARIFAGKFEAKLQHLAPKLPTPLQQMIKKDLARIPADPANSKMLPAERMQVCVNLLNELDKFNNSVNLFSDKRTNAAGEEVAVETMYVGLGAAYFVNDAGDFAGVGASGPDGWTWTTQPEIAPAVRMAVKVYRSEQPPAFVKLPATIQ